MFSGGGGPWRGSPVFLKCPEGESTGGSLECPGQKVGLQGGGVSRGAGPRVGVSPGGCLLGVIGT